MPSIFQCWAFILRMQPPLSASLIQQHPTDGSDDGIPHVLKFEIVSENRQ